VVHGLAEPYSANAPPKWSAKASFATAFGIRLVADGKHLETDGKEV
jgi:hypothetical protein